MCVRVGVCERAKQKENLHLQQQTKTDPSCRHAHIYNEALFLSLPVPSSQAQASASAVGQMVKVVMSFPVCPSSLCHCVCVSGWLGKDVVVKTLSVFCLRYLSIYIYMHSSLIISISIVCVALLWSFSLLLSIRYSFSVPK